MAVQKLLETRCTTTSATGEQESSRTTETESKWNSSSASELWTTGTHEGAESEHKGQPYEDRAVKAAETNKMRDYNQPPSTQAVHNIPMTFDVYGRWGEKAELTLKQAARRRLEKRDALTATRSERTLGALLSKWRAQGAVAVQLRNFEVYRDCFAGTEELPSQVRPR